MLAESVKIKTHSITTNKVFLWQCSVMQVMPDADWYIKELY